MSGKIPSEGAWQMLAELDPTLDRAKRNHAGLALQALVERAVQRVVPARRADAAEEVRSAVMANVILKYERSIRALVDSTRDDHARRDDRCVAFIATMTHNCWVNVVRRENTNRRNQNLDDAEKNAPSESFHAPAREPPEVEIVAVLSIVQRVVDAAAEARQPKYRDDLQKSWSLICEIACEERTIREILARDEGLGESASQAELTAARNRIYKRCSRLRRELLGRADTLQRDRHLSDEEHRLVVAFITGVAVRCQKPTPSSV